MTFEFEGFSDPTSNYCRVPNVLFDHLHVFDTKAELAVVLYVLRHTWGYQEFDSGRRISIDEFMNGRRRLDGRRIDNGIGMSAPSIRDGIERAVEHGFLEVEVDDQDQGRVKKFYQLRMKGVKKFDPHEKDFDLWAKNSSLRTQKDTIEKQKREKQSDHNKQDATPGGGGSLPESLHGLVEDGTASEDQLRDYLAAKGEERVRLVMAHYRAGVQSGDIQGSGWFHEAIREDWNLGSVEQPVSREDWRSYVDDPV